MAEKHEKHEKRKTSSSDIDPTVKKSKSIDEQKIKSLLAEAELLRERNKISDAILRIEQVLNLDDKNVNALTSMGLCLKLLGKTKESMTNFKKAIELDPNNEYALIWLGILHKESHSFKEAIQYFLKALSINPSNIDAKNNIAITYNDYGTHLKISGNTQAGMEQYHKCIKYSPNYAGAYYNLGVVYSECGKYDEAIKYYEKAISLNPRYVEALCNLGVIAKNTGNLVRAIECYDKALNVSPNLKLLRHNMAIALTDMGTHLKKNGKLKEGIKYYKKALLYNATYAEAYYNLGVAYAEIKRFEKAVYMYQLATQFNPNCAEAFNNMGVIYKHLGNMEQAIHCYKMALAKNPTFVQTLNNLGVIYTMQGKMDDALELVKKAIENNPLYAEAYNNCGVILRDEGKVDEAMEAYDKCLSIDKYSRNAGQNRLLALNYKEGVDLDYVYKEHEKWGNQFMQLYKQYTEWKNEKNPDKVLKIGYLSSDYFTHSVSYFIEAPLRYHNREKFQIYCYSNVPKDDQKTQMFKSLNLNWRDIYGVPTEQVAQMIRDDEIDILVELTGHTANNRLDITAMKPAPIQITWIGYPNTCGLKTIDYRIVDSFTDPVESKQNHVEKLIRLKHFLCYTPSSFEKADVLPPPVLKTNVITFGTFNNMAKITHRVSSIWAKILKQIPNSRLLVKSKPFESPRVRKEFTKRFTDLGIDASRIDLLSLIPSHGMHLGAYSLLDISLDTFPYAGTTTTCEALYMGVPVVVLAGDRHSHNVGISLLNAVGYPELVAKTEDEYIKIAVQLAKDVERLKKIRNELRPKMLNSPLCDGKSFTQELEQQFGKIWRAYCNETKK